MSSQPIYLLCGVPGSGKTWVASQLRSQYRYVPHDDHIDGNLIQELRKAAKGDKPVLTECPFGERVLRAKLELMGLQVKAVFIVEDARVVSKRYFSDRGRLLPKSSWTRAGSIVERAKEWKAPYGTSSEILAYLRNGTDG